jgi:hypothetical protein
MHGRSIQDTDAVLNQSVEEMDLLAGSIWSPPVHDEPIQPFYQPELYAAG